MTTTQAATKYDIPVGRIRRAIHMKWLKAELDGGRYKFSKKDMKRAFKGSTVVKRVGRMFITYKTKKLLIVETGQYTFSTTGGADEYEQMLNK